MVKKALYHTSVGLLLVLVIVSNIEPIKAERRLFYLWQDLTKKPNTEPITVKPEDLILNSHKYHGDCITISGTLHIEFESDSLILFSDFGDDNETIYLRFEGYIAPNEAMQFQGELMNVTGIYYAYRGGVFGNFHSVMAPVNYIDGSTWDIIRGPNDEPIGDKDNKCERTRRRSLYDRDTSNEQH